MEHQSLSVLQKDGTVASYCFVFFSFSMFFFLPSLHYSNEKWGKLCLNCLYCLKDKHFIISFFGVKYDLTSNLERMLPG